MSIADKRAALELHGLSGDDRDWVLGRLAPTEQARMKPLLAELDRMNIRFDVGNEENQIEADGNGVRGTAAISQAPASARSVIRNAEAAEMTRLLSGEPAWLIRALLALDTWPWSTTVGGALAEQGVLRTQPAVRTAVVHAPALTEALLSLIAARLQDSAQVPMNGHHNGHRVNGSAAGIRIWDRVWPRVRQWLP